MTRKQVVVIGAGIAGLTSGALLASQGYSVTILEKNDAPGGRAAQFSRDGFVFDGGPTLLFMLDVYRMLFNELGADFDDLVPTVRLQPSYRLNFSDGKSLELSSSLPEVMAQLERFQRGAGAGFLRYAAGCARSYEIARRDFVGKRIRRWSEFLAPGKVAALVRSGAFHSLSRASRRAFGSLSPAMSFQSMYLGMSPFRSPALYRLLFFTELEGVFFPLGGIGAFVRALERLAIRHGVRVVYDAEVTSLQRTANSVTGVVARDRAYRADVVVATADLPYVYRALLSEPDHRSLRMRRTPSALLLYAALERRYEELRHHEFLIPRDMRTTCEDIFDRRSFPRDPAIYLASPTATDPSMAPAGKDALYVLVPAPDAHGNVDWRASARALAEATLQRIERLRLPGLRDRIRWYVVRTPADLRDELNLIAGSAFGLSHDIFQIGPLRPDNRHRRFRNLFFAGASTRPATGIPLVTLGAMHTAERIAEELPA